jgi:hypothetical protein
LYVRFYLTPDSLCGSNCRRSIDESHSVPREPVCHGPIPELPALSGRIDEGIVSRILKDEKFQITGWAQINAQSDY